MNDAHFIGVLRLGESTVDPTQLEVESKKFAFVDKRGVRWEAHPGDLAGGAHIPWYVKPILGGSYQEPYLRAAVLHDIYCRSKVRSWQDTHNMFYWAMIVSGVNVVKARIMWSAVWVFGPKW